MAETVNGFLTDDAEPEVLEAVVGSEHAGKRFDLLVSELFQEAVPSRSRARKLIDDGDALIDGKRGKAGTPLKGGETLTLIPPETEEWTVEPEDIPLDIIYEDGDIIVVNKPRGMVVHPAAGNRTGTLANALMHHCRDLSGVGGVLRPGIVHRIDRDTTGLLAAAKNDRAHIALSEQLSSRRMHRIYLAVTEGVFKDAEGTVEAPIGRNPKDRKTMAVVASGKEALTRYKVLSENRKEGVSLLGLSLDTGRTHQIRVHMRYIGHPVSGDPVYGVKNRRGMTGQALHAGILLLDRPSDGKRMRFECPPPEDTQKLIVRTGLQDGEEKFWKCDW